MIQVQFFFKQFKCWIKSLMKLYFQISSSNYGNSLKTTDFCMMSHPKWELNTVIIWRVHQTKMVFQVAVCMDAFPLASSSYRFFLWIVVDSHAWSMSPVSPSSIVLCGDTCASCAFKIKKFMMFVTLRGS